MLRKFTLSGCCHNVHGYLDSIYTKINDGFYEFQNPSLSAWDNVEVWPQAFTPHPRYSPLPNTRPPIPIMESQMARLCHLLFRREARARRNLLGTVPGTVPIRSVRKCSVSVGIRNYHTMSGAYRTMSNNRGVARQNLVQSILFVPVGIMTQNCYARGVTSGCARLVPLIEGAIMRFVRCSLPWCL